MSYATIKQMIKLEPSNEQTSDKYSIQATDFYDPAYLLSHQENFIQHVSDERKKTYIPKTVIEATSPYAEFFRSFVSEIKNICVSVLTDYNNKLLSLSKAMNALRIIKCLGIQVENIGEFRHSELK